MSFRLQVQDMLFGGLIKRTLGFINIPMAFFMVRHRVLLLFLGDVVS